MNNNLQKQEQVEQPTLNVHQIEFDLQKQFLLDHSLALEQSKLVVKNSLFANGTDKLDADLINQHIRFFELTKFVYEKDITIAYKLRSVFSALHSVNCPLLVKLISDGTTYRFLIGTKSDSKVSDKEQVLRGAIEGNFPGTSFKHRTENPDIFSLKSEEILALNNNIFDSYAEISAVVGIPSVKDKEEGQFIQGIENLILGMNNRPFTALFIANPISTQEVDYTINAYEQIASLLSVEKEFVVTQGENSSFGESSSETKGSSESRAEGETKGNTYSQTRSTTTGTNNSTSTSSNPWIGKKIARGIVGGKTKNFSKGTNYSESSSQTTSNNTSTSTTTTWGTNSSETNGYSQNVGNSSSEQRTYTNKKVSNFLDRLDKQIERLEQGKGIGFWNVGAYFLSDQPGNSTIAANIYNGIIKGAESNFETSTVRTFNALSRRDKQELTKYLRQYEIPQLENGNFLAQAVNTNELTVQINFPQKSITGLDVVEVTPFGANPSPQQGRNIQVGYLFNFEKKFKKDIQLDIDKFTGHIFVTGSTGSGKSNVTYNLIDQLTQKGIQFMVIEPAKGEYKDEFGGREDVKVYGTNPKYTQLLKVNPFYFPENIHIYEHIDRFIEILNACWPMEAAMPNLLKAAVEDAYLRKGWLLDESRCIAESPSYPVFTDLLISLEQVVNKSKFSQELKGNYQGALLSRVSSMTNGLNKLIFAQEGIPDTELFDQNVIVDLSRVASSEEKALLMGILFMKLNEYRIASKTGNNSHLKHITILEEAHNLLKRTSSEQSADGANLAGKSVEMISNAIAEMRTYGEGFIIADQAPGLLDMSAIRNTNTKICLRLPDMEDRKLVGNAMNLTEDQIKELASLQTGVAAIYQNDWQEAILCKFNKFVSKSREFTYTDTTKIDKARNVERVCSLIEQYTKEKELSAENILFINDTIALEFLLQQDWDKSLRPDELNILLTKRLMKITNLDHKQVKPIVKYVVHLLKKIDSSSKLASN